MNSFFSTERFRRAHVTTGTVFYHSKTDQHFVAASPACDLVARRPSPDQWWLHSIFPFTPLVAVLLAPSGIDAALGEAADGLHIFLENSVDRRAFKIVSGSGRQPSYEFFMIKNEGRVREEVGKTIFEAARLSPKVIEEDGVTKISLTERDWTDDSFEVVDQLRGINATRILQLAGQHLSRIGLDFISTPTTGNG